MSTHLSLTETRLDPDPSSSRRPDVVSDEQRAWTEALMLFDVDARSAVDLGDDELSQLRHRLLGALDDLIDRIAAVRAVRRRPGGQTADTVDAVLEDRVRLHERSLEATTEALAAIDAGVYGLCRRCRRPIGFTALWADPLTTTCVPQPGPEGTRHGEQGR